MCWSESGQIGYAWFIGQRQNTTGNKMGLATATITFRGTRIALLSVHDAGNGIAAFSLDGGTETTRDHYLPARQGFQLGYLSPRVPYGKHVLRVRASDAAGNTSAWASATVEFGGSRVAPAAFTRDESWVTGLDAATAIAQAPDGRFFVAQQGGALRVVKAGVLLATPFIQLTVDPNGERGLIGVTLHPNFANNGWVYLYHTTPENGTHNRISRFTVNPANPDIVSVGSTHLRFEAS